MLGFHIAYVDVDELNYLRFYHPDPPPLWKPTIRPLRYDGITF